MSRAQCSSIGRALGPLSPPTMTQEIPSRSISPTGPRKGLDGQETNGNRRPSKMPDSGGSSVILDGHPAPDVPRRLAPFVSPFQIALHQRASFRQYLKDVAVGFLHDIEDAINEFCRNFLVEQITHRIHEYLSGSFPREWLGEPFRAECQVEPSFEGMPRRTPEPLGEAFGIAIVAAARDLGAACHRVPGSVGPFNCGLVAHDRSPVLSWREAAKAGLPPEAVGLRSSPCSSQPLITQVPPA